MLKRILFGRGRWLWLIGIALVCAFLIAWSRFYPGVSAYVPDSAVSLKGTRRTSAEHDAIYPKTTFPYVVDIKGETGRLLFLGIQHTNDPNDPQLREIERLWREMRPDVALVEGRIRGYFGNLDHAAKRGEPYFVFALARRHGTAIYTLEPDPKVEGEALAQAESPDRALMFLTLRGYLSDKKSGPVHNEEVDRLLSKRAKEYGIDSKLATTKDMDSMWAKDFPNGPDWRTMNEKMMWPGEEKSYLNHLANVANEVRDEHWAKTMVDLTRKGKKVFAVGGASHTIILEPVLRATLGATKGR